VIRYLRIREDRHGRTIEAMVWEDTPLIEEAPTETAKRDFSPFVIFPLRLVLFGSFGYFVGTQIAGAI